MVQKEYLYVGVIVVLLAVIAYLYSQNTLSTVTQNAAVENVKSIYGLLTENPVEVISVKEESGIYRVLIRTTNQAGTQNVQEIFATKDGSFLTDRIINSTGYVQALTREKNFAECLASSRVVVAGVSTEANTVAQLQTLSPNFWYKFYVDCSGANLQICESAGIQQVPTIIFGNLNQSLQGVQTLALVQQASGCTL